MARHAQRRRPRGQTQLAAATRIRPLLRDHPRRRQLLRSRLAHTRERADQAREQRLLLHRRDRRSRRQIHRRVSRRQALLSLLALHRRPLAAARPRRRDRQVQGPLRRRLGQAARRALPAHDRDGRHQARLAALPTRSQCARLGGRREQGVVRPPHGGLRRAGLHHGQRYRARGHKTEGIRKIREHPRVVSHRQRRLRRRAAPRRDGAPHPDGDAGRPPGQPRQRPD